MNNQIKIKGISKNLLLRALTICVFVVNFEVDDEFASTLNFPSFK